MAAVRGGGCMGGGCKAGGGVGVRRGLAGGAGCQVGGGVGVRRGLAGGAGSGAAVERRGWREAPGRFERLACCHRLCGCVLQSLWLAIQSFTVCSLSPTTYEL